MEQVSYYGPKMLGATLENFVALVTWCAGFVYRCYAYRLLANNVPYVFLLMGITLSAMSVYTLQTILAS